MRTDAEAQKRVARMIGRYGFTEAVDRLEVNRGLVYRVWKFALYSPTVRRALKLPVKLVPAPPCACGKVHTVPWCTEKKGAPVPETEKEIVYVEVKPEPKPKRKSKRTAANGHFRRAVWIHEDDMPLFDALLARHGVRNLQELIDNHMIYRRRLDDDRRRD